MNPIDTIEPNSLDQICGGQTVTRRGTPEQVNTFNQCVQDARGKSVFKPSTWSRPNETECVGNLLDSVLQNPPA